MKIGTRVHKMASLDLQRELLRLEEKYELSYAQLYFILIEALKGLNRSHLHDDAQENEECGTEVKSAAQVRCVGCGRLHTPRSGSHLPGPLCRDCKQMAERCEG